MFSSLNNEDLYDENYPLFLSMVLLPTFDPTNNFTDFPSHIYDELPNDLFRHYLQKIVRNQPENSSFRFVDSEFKKASRGKFRQSMREGKMDIDKVILGTFLPSELAIKWNYQIKDYHIIDVLQHGRKSTTFVIRLRLCLHKEECAYGKVVDEEIGIEIDAKRYFLISMNLTGIVPQQNIVKDMQFLAI